jgi:hypothetical protein
LHLLPVHPSNRSLAGYLSPLYPYLSLTGLPLPGPVGLLVRTRHAVAAASSTRAATPRCPGRGYRGGLSRGPMPSVQHCLDIACGLPPPLLLCACASQNPTRQIVLICSEFFLCLCYFCYCDSALAIACNRSLIQTGHLPGSKKNQCMQLSQPLLWPFFV